jgi:uncharacterized protein (TIGR03083 family)
MTLSHDRYCDQIEGQAALLADHLGGADLTRPVASCPGWNLAMLTQHVGEELRWLAGMVRTRATSMADDTAMRDLSPVPARSGAETGAWIAAGAGDLVDALRVAGPDAAMWTPLPDGTAYFFARRFAHETTMHRADAALTLGVPVEIDADVAADALAEWMELGALPAMLDFHPHRRALLGAGRTLRFTATDAEADWFVDNTGPVMVHRSAGSGDRATAEVSGPLTDLLLYLYQRADGENLTVTGDAGYLATWRAANAFG